MQGFVHYYRKADGMTKLETMGAAAKAAAVELAQAGALKNSALQNCARLLKERESEILTANDKDLSAAAENGISETMADRLRLTSERISDMAKGILDVAAEPDPVGKILSGETRPNGLKLEKITVPLGVIGIIYESRPNVTGDAAALCLKAGNTVILRGGKEAIHSNIAIADILRDALAEVGMPRDCIQLIEDTSRESASELMGLTDYLDVLIPRGGGGLISSVKKNAKVPVIETGVGNCHIYVDEFADIGMAAEIIYNAKTSRPSVCNTIETILVHESIAESCLPLIKSRLDEKNVELRACPRAIKLLPGAVPAVPEDWDTEFLDYILAVKIVDSIDEAMAHIERHSSHHSEAIITKDYQNAEKFIAGVDSAAVYINSSTRFTDGGEFGLGAEIGISTQKLHARGPMGLAQLTSYKFVVRGDGQVR